MDHRPTVVKHQIRCRYAAIGKSYGALGLLSCKVLSTFEYPLDHVVNIHRCLHTTGCKQPGREHPRNAFAALSLIFLAKTALNLAPGHKTPAFARAIIFRLPCHFVSQVFVSSPVCSMQYRQLRYFVKVVEAGSFSRAAATIHVAQPALSQQIAELEEEMGHKLLHRTPRGVQPTAAGQILFERASSILRRLDELPGVLKSSTGQVAGTVSLGIVASLAELLTGPVVEHIASELPKVMLKCSDGDTEALSARVLAQKLDLALVFEKDFAPTFSRTPLFSQRFYLVGRSLPGKTRTSVTLEEIAPLPLILPGDFSERRRIIDQAFAALNLTPNVIAEADNLPSELSAVRTGIGHTVLNVGELPKNGYETFAKPLIIEPPISMTCSVIASGDVNLSSAGEAIRASIVPFIRSLIRTSKRAGTHVIDE